MRLDARKILITALDHPNAVPCCSARTTVRDSKIRGENNKREDGFLSGAVAVEFCRFRVLGDVMKGIQTSDNATDEIYELRSSPSG